MCLHVWELAVEVVILLIPLSEHVRAEKRIFLLVFCTINILLRRLFV